MRLQPGAEQKLKFRNNPLTTLRVNDAGYRGKAFPEPTPGEILVVGDSQVFGLGVEENETFSAKLAELTGKTVINGGIPTYGPYEYTAVVREMLAERKPATVIYVVNFVNDLFEAERLNRDRHEVWDGWAVRSETMPTDVVQFPGRQWLFSQSHLVYAARRWLYQYSEKLDDRGFASEGTWSDLANSGEEASAKHSERQKRAEALNAQQAERLSEVRKELASTEADIESLMFDVFDELDGGYGDSALRLKAARGSPGDIVRDEAVEEGREIALTAAIVRRGVLYRNRLAANLAKAKNTPDKEKLASALATRGELLDERASLHSRDIETVHIPSVLEPRIREVKKLCDDSGAQLVIVALPIDVQVSSGEWAKYGVTEPIDMAPTRVLLSDLVASAEKLGARAIDVTPALAAVKEPAFLDHDIHMTPAGHDAVAAALAKKLAEPVPLPPPDLGLPEGRTRLPDPETWRTTLEAIVAGSSKAKCETMYIGEWFRATCLPAGRSHVPTAIEIVTGGHGEAMTVATKDGITLVTPLFDGEEFVADFFWKSHSQRFIARWPKGRARPLMWYQDRKPPGKERIASEAQDRLCECHKEVEKEKVCKIEQGWPTGECNPTCVNLYGQPSDECMAAFADDCDKLLRCVRGDPSALPPCPPGKANAGGTGQCFTLCSKDHPCAEGVCTPWQDSAICRPEPVPAKTATPK